MASKMIDELINVVADQEQDFLKKWPNDATFIIEHFNTLLAAIDKVKRGDPNV